MKNSKNTLEQDKVLLKKAIDKIPAEKLDRALIILTYMSKASTEDCRAISEYSKLDEVTLDMMVAWVKNKQNKEQSLLQGVV